MIDKNDLKYKLKALEFIYQTDIEEPMIDEKYNELSESLLNVYNNKVYEFYMQDLIMYLYKLVEEIYNKKYIEIACTLSGREINQAGIEAYKVKYQKCLEYKNNTITEIPVPIQIEAQNRGLDPETLVDIIIQKGKLWNSIIDNFLLAMEAVRAKIQVESGEDKLLLIIDKLNKLDNTSFRNQSILANISSFIIGFMKGI